MKTNKKRLSAVFAPDTRFDVTASVTAPYRVVLDTEFERLQRRRLHELLHRTSDPDLNLLYRHAANEAAALASASGFPLLLWPLLFEEKAEAARRYAQRQARIRAQIPELAEEIPA